MTHVKHFLAILVLIASCTEARSQALCSSRQALADVIFKSRFHEALAFTAKVEGVDMDFYLNPETGTWTVVYITAAGLACIRVVGTDFKPAAALSQGDPS